MIHKRIIYIERDSAICARIPKNLKKKLEEYTKRFRVSQADVIICLLADLNISKDITLNDK